MVAKWRFIPLPIGSECRRSSFHEGRLPTEIAQFSPTASLILAGTCEDPVVSKPAMRKWILIFVCLTQVCRLQAQREQDPIQAILQLFEQHPIVMFGEVHGCVQEHALTEETRDLAGVRRSRERRGD